jgi:hypothetical protein
MGEGTGVGGLGLMVGCPANAAAGFSVRRRMVLPLLEGEGRGEDALHQRFGTIGKWSLKICYLSFPAKKKSAARGGTTIAGCAAIWLTAAASSSAAGALNNHRQRHGKLVRVIISIDGVAAGLGRTGMEIVEVKQHGNRCKFGVSKTWEWGINTVTAATSVPPIT